MKILTAAQMREVDRLTSERFGVPSILLMETAAARVVETMTRELGAVEGKSVLVVCGPGNNGGDGAAVARQLHARGCRPTVLLLGRLENTKGDARANFAAAQKLGADRGNFQFLEISGETPFAWDSLPPTYDFYIDAIFGTGLSRPVSGLFEQAIDYLQHCSPVVAVDLPSGLNADVAQLMGKTVRADLTVTFTAPKLANLLPPASDWNGNVVIRPIGSPAILIDESASQLSVIDRPQVQAWLASSRRRSDAHKGDAGKVLLIAGSRGKVGAACLAGEAAMRAGTGLVTIATAASAQAALAARVIAECMTEALADDAGGKVVAQASARALELAAERDVVALGPGLGTPGESLGEFVRQQITGRRGPVVIDADGLNALVAWVAELQGSADYPLILTPHPGEMARLVGKSTGEVAANRVDIARDFAVRHQVIVVLKGSRTVIAAPDGEVFINPTGNAGMATGGSGDVLTGMLAGLLAQKPGDALGATIAAVYLHGLAGDLAASQIGVRALLASDLSAHLGAAFLEVGGEAEKP